MIIPVSPVPVRIALQTQAISNGGYAVHDIDVAELIEKADSAQYELQLCYDSTTLYRSSVYQINKNTRSIPFFFMVGSDLYTATLSNATNRCTFAKMSSGLSETQVVDLIHRENSAGVGVYLSNVDDQEGFTISLSDVNAAVGQLAAGRLLLIGGDNVAADFYFTQFGGWQFVGTPFTGTDYQKVDVSVDGKKTGMHITHKDVDRFNAYVIWYTNPDYCVVEPGTYQPASGG